MVKLAQELQRLSLAEEEYLNYFLWKAELREENQVERLHANWKGCQLCKALNQQRPSNSYHDNALITGTLLMPCLAPAALGLVELCKNWRKWKKSWDVFVVLFPDTFEYNKMSRNRRNDKIPWESHLFKRLCCLSCFLTFFFVKKLSRNRKNPRK